MDLSERGSATARHPWEIQRLAAYRRILGDHDALDAVRVLDVGAGDGWFAEQLLPHLPHAEQVVCWDINYNELELVTSDQRLMRTIEPPTPGFDLVLLLDVLEHIEQPTEFIRRQLAPLTTAGTAVLVGVPAIPALFSNHDRALGHHRRYRPRQLLEQLSGWIDVVAHGPMFVSLVPPRAASTLVERVRKVEFDPDQPHGVGDWGGGVLLTRTLDAVLAADTAATLRLGRLGARLPGLSHWAFGYVR